MRYFNQEIFTNMHTAYRRYLESRGKKDIIQYMTPRLKHPTEEDSLSFNTVNHIWKSGDKYYKLANQHYNDPTMWWVIALYNQKPTEFHMVPGDIVYIPTPLETVLYYVGL